MNPVIFCDFDGTVTDLDVTDEILARLAHPSWRAIEQEWVRGLIGSRECLERQIALVVASAREINSLIDSIPIDRHFPKFYWFCRKRGLPFYLLSDSFDYIIRRALKRCGLNGLLCKGKHLFASALRIQGQRLITSFPYSSPACEHGCATCKAAVIRQFAGARHPIIFIGDGQSDRFAVKESDWVFAKGQLLAYCRANDIACHPFKTFDDIDVKLASLLGRGARTRERWTLAGALK